MRYAGSSIDMSDFQQLKGKKQSEGKNITINGKKQNIKNEKIDQKEKA